MTLWENVMLISKFGRVRTPKGRCYSCLEKELCFPKVLKESLVSFPVSSVRPLEGREGRALCVVKGLTHWI